MTRLATLVALLALTVVLVTGCGVSKDNYDAAVKEANDLRNQLSEVQADLVTAQADLNKSNSDLATAQQNLDNVLADRDSILHQLEETEADLSTAEANLATTQTNLSKSNADLATAQQSFSILNTSVKTYQPYVDVAIAYFEMQKQYHMGVAWDTIVGVYIPEIESAVYDTQDSAFINGWWDFDPTEISFYELLVKRLDELKPNSQ
jgi:septal ring factor EnvC (AmiA/AmiB activator)